MNSGTSKRIWEVVSDPFLGTYGRFIQFISWLIVLLIVIRLLLPVVLTYTANQAIRANDKIRGEVGDISLGIINGVYILHDIRLWKKNNAQQWEPLLEIQEATCHIPWSSIITARFEGDLSIINPELFIYNNKTEQVPEIKEEQVTMPPVTETGTSNMPLASWHSHLKPLIQMRLKYITITNGSVHYIDEDRGIKTAITDVTGSLKGLLVPKGSTTHRSPCAFKAQTPGHGVMSIDGEVDILASGPTFYIRSKIENLQLIHVNDLLTGYENLLFKGGEFNGYTELVADGRKVDGYIKIIFKNLDIDTFRDYKDDSIKEAFYSFILETAEQILENEPENQHAARIPLSGITIKPEVDVWSTVGSALYNAFISALAPGFDSWETKKE